MSTEDNNQDVDLDDTGEGEGSETEAESVVRLRREEYDKLQRDLGSAKRELKDLKKPKEESKETPIPNQKPDEALLQKVERLALKQHNITHADDVELARSIAKRTGKEIDEVLEDDYFKFQLEKQQTSRANVEATSEVRGDGSGSSSKAKETTEYWQKQGTPPTPADVPDRKTRQRIISEMILNTRNNKTLSFYNE